MQEPDGEENIERPQKSRNTYSHDEGHAVAIVVRVTPAQGAGGKGNKEGANKTEEL